jgi:hypothetical protein
MSTSVETERKSEERVSAASPQQLDGGTLASILLKTCDKGSTLLWLEEDETIALLDGYFNLDEVAKLIASTILAVVEK